MLVFAADGTFTDHRDPALVYRPPGELVPVAGPGGVPDVLLSVGAAGGLLRVRLGEEADVAPGAPRCPIASGRCRVVVRSPADASTGAWQSSPVTSTTIVDRSIRLSASEAGIARRLVDAGDAVVDVEAELEVRGLVAPLPWIARIPHDHFAAVLGAILGDAPATWDAIEAAVASVDLGEFEWTALEPAAIPPPADAARRALASAARGRVVAADGAGSWVLLPADDTMVSLSLATPAASAVLFQRTWSMRSFLEGVADPSRHVVVHAAPDALEVAEVTVVNDVPLAHDGIRSVTVELRTDGPSGALELEFSPSAAAGARLRYVRESFRSQRPTWRARVVFVAGGTVAVHTTEFVDAGESIEVTPKAIGLTPLSITVDPEVFDIADRITVALGDPPIVLDRTRPSAAVVGRRPPASVEVAATFPNGVTEQLGPLPVVGGAVTVGPDALGIGTATLVELRLAAAADRLAYAAVEIAGGPWRTLEPEATITWPVRLPHRFAEPHLRYRTRHVPTRADGTTAPIVESGWRDVTGATVEVEV